MEEITFYILGWYLQSGSRKQHPQNKRRHQNRPIKRRTRAELAINSHSRDVFRSFRGIEGDDGFNIDHRDIRISRETTGGNEVLIAREKESATGKLGSGDLAKLSGPLAC